MTTSTDLVFYFSPHTRAETVLWMLEELGQPYETRLLSLKLGEHKQPDYLAVNPMGKVPAIVHRGVVVTETPAICAYLADAFPKAGLSVPLDDPRRGPYLRWLFFAHGCVEPAILDRSLDRESGPPSTVGYGTFEKTFEVLADALAEGPYLLGEQFTAADVVVGAGLGWAVMFTKSVPDRPEFSDYLGRINARPALIGARTKSAEMQAELEKRYADEGVE